MESDKAFVFHVHVPYDLSIGTLNFDILTLTLGFDDNVHLWNLPCMVYLCFITRHLVAISYLLSVFFENLSHPILAGRE
jgi:hypothetical protein